MPLRHYCCRHADADFRFSLLRHAPLFHAHYLRRHYRLLIDAAVAFSSILMIFFDAAATPC